MVDRIKHGVSLITEKTFLDRRHYKYQAFPLQVEGLLWRGKQEESGRDFVEIDAKLPAAPVGFTELFRYSTPFKLFLNAIGVVGAMVAGAAQPLAALVFGRLIQDFVRFTTALEIYQSTVSSGKATEISSARPNIDFAARELRRAAA